MRERVVRVVAGIIAVQGAMACGAAAAPQELHNARHAYTQASQGPAAQLAPAQLDTARQGLERANMAFGSGADEAVVRDLAYIAERQVALAVSAAALEQATRNIALYDKQKEDLRRQQEQQMESELERTKRELEAQKLAVAAEREARLAAERHAAAALQSLSSMANVTETSRGVVITMAASTLFSGSAHALMPLAKDRLRQVARALLEQGNAKIVVEGHTDTRGSAEKNLELSSLRAREVRSYLISQGIPSDNIQAAGLGEERPIATSETAEGRASNQRVEIVVSPTTSTPKSG